MNWYYADNGQQKGPINELDLATLARNGSIKPDTLVWREGLTEWQQLSLARPDLANVEGSPSIGGVYVAEQQKDLIVQQMREGVVPGQVLAQNPHGFVYAGFWIRVAAKIIDSILISIVNYTLMFLIMGSVAGFGALTKPSANGEDPAVNAAAMGAMLLMYLLIFGINISYNTFMVSKYGGTLGKLAVGIKVVRTDGAMLSIPHAIGRACAEILSGMTCYIGYIMVAFDEPEKRALHDHICSTRVVQK
jgi:uncharacterized RDD family membrane protein YckC